MIVRFPVVLALAAVLAGGCSHAPRIELAEPAMRPDLTAGTTYALAVEAERLPAETAGVEALRRTLARHGWREAAEAPAWTVRATYVVRPEQVGVLGPQDGEWLVQPRRTPWWRKSRTVHTLTLSLIPSGAQRESYRVSASVSGPAAPSDTTMQTLVEAAVRRLDPQAPQSPIVSSSARGSTTTKQAPPPSV